MIRPEHPCTHTGKLQVTEEQEWRQETPSRVLCFLSDPGLLPGMRKLPLARDSTTQLYFGSRRGEKAISWEALTSMLGMGDSSPNPEPQPPAALDPDAQ